MTVVRNFLPNRVLVMWHYMAFGHSKVSSHSLCTGLCVPLKLMATGAHWVHLASGSRPVLQREEDGRVEESANAHSEGHVQETPWYSGKRLAVEYYTHLTDKVAQGQRADSARIGSRSLLALNPALCSCSL